MNWTKTPPTKPGAYWWRTGFAPVIVRLLEIYISVEGEPIACGHATHGDAESLGGEWCGPLVSVEEVENAYQEGWRDCLFTNAMLDESFATSRARKIVEGEL